MDRGLILFTVLTMEITNKYKSNMGETWKAGGKTKKWKCFVCLWNMPFIQGFLTNNNVLCVKLSLNLKE